MHRFYFRNADSYRVILIACIYVLVGFVICNGVLVFRVPTGQGKLENFGEFVLSGKSIIFEKSGKMIFDRADCG